jgi:hypothetical protein
VCARLLDCISLADVAGDFSRSHRDTWYDSSAILARDIQMPLRAQQTGSSDTPKPPERVGVLSKLAGIWEKPDWSALFGYDIFVSYRREDASEFVLALVRDLSELDFSCFVDRTNAPPGVPLTPRILLALRRSRVLLVIVTQGALASPWVTDEISIFRRDRKKLVLPIDADHVFRNMSTEAATAWRDLRAAEPIWINVTGEQIRSGNPPSQLAGEIKRLFDYLRANTIRRLLTLFIMVFLLTTTGVAVWQAARSTRNEKIANERLVAILERQVDDYLNSRLDIDVKDPECQSLVKEIRANAAISREVASRIKPSADPPNCCGKSAYVHWLDQGKFYKALVQ